MPFDGLAYTYERLVKNFLLVEEHCKDGSASKGECSCIQDKHLQLIGALGDEGQPLTKDATEKKYFVSVAKWAEVWLEAIYEWVSKTHKYEESMEFYGHLADQCRSLRLMIESGVKPFQSSGCGCEFCVPCKGIKEPQKFQPQPLMEL